MNTNVMGTYQKLNGLRFGTLVALAAIGLLASCKNTDCASDVTDTALIVHATADDQKTGPSGNSGSRTAAGVINRN